MCFHFANLSKSKYLAWCTFTHMLIFLCLINNIIPNRPWVFANVELLMWLMMWWSGSQETRCSNTKGHVTHQPSSSLLES